MSEPNHDPALAAIAASLRDLMPAGAINRDRVLFEAGRRSVRSRGWPLATGAFAALAAILGVRLATLPVAAPRVEMVHSAPPVVQPPTSDLPVADERVVRKLGPIDRLFPGLPLTGRADALRLPGDVAAPRLSAGSVAPPPVERWLGVPSILLDDSLKLHSLSGSLRGEA